MQEQTRQAAARGDAAVTPLADLDLTPYLDENGMITKVETKGVKASVYAIYDEVSKPSLPYLFRSSGELEPRWHRRLVPVAPAPLVRDHKSNGKSCRGYGPSMACTQGGFT